MVNGFTLNLIIPAVSTPKTARFSTRVSDASKSGRKDDDYAKWRWQPDGCDLPRSTVYEVHGIPITKQRKGSFSVRFEEYNLTVEYYRSPFLVTLDRPPKGSSEIVCGTIRVDTLQRQSKLSLGADVLVFNDGHWWNKDKTTGMGLYFQEGNIVNMTMDAEEAFRSLETWKSWAMNTAKLQKSHIFSRSYSPVHYRDGTWNGGGHCNKFISQIIKSMEAANKRVQFLNITYLSEFRHDGHPFSLSRARHMIPIIQDCSHWRLGCLTHGMNSFMPTF